MRLASVLCVVADAGPGRARRLGFEDPGEAATELAGVAGTQRENERDREGIVERMRALAARLSSCWASAKTWAQRPFS